MSDVIVPIVFPDYLISTPAGKLPQLGHAGILLILGTVGLTKYYEYGRYDSANLGLARKVSIPDAKPTSSGIDLGSLTKVMKAISQKSGQNGRISAAYIEVSGGFEKANKYALKRIKDNSNSKREAYDILFNSCCHFMKQTMEAAGLSTPWLVDPRPNSYIEEIRDMYKDLDYSPGGGQVTLGN